MKTPIFENFPQAIYNQQMKLHSIQQELQAEQQKLAYLDSDIELAIAGDRDLKNETMRKAKRLELRQDQDYLDIKMSIDELSDCIVREKILLEHFRNCFSVEKINKRMAIAQIEAGEIAA